MRQDGFQAIIPSFLKEFSRSKCVFTGLIIAAVGLLTSGFVTVTDSTFMSSNHHQRAISVTVETQVRRCSETVMVFASLKWIKPSDV